MDQPSIIRGITSQGVKAVLPEYGDYSSLSELLGDQAGARLLLLQPGRESQRRSWLVWFSQIRKYRRSLIEVLLFIGVASQSGSASCYAADIP